MELRQLRYFVVLAEELHFGRAASRVGICQPPFSQQIKALETGLGARLVERSTRRVALTDAGRLFLEEARSALERIDRAAEVARRAQHGELGELRVGMFPSAPLIPLVGSSIRTFRRRFPDVRLRLEEFESRRQIEALADRQQDVAITRSVAAPVLPHGLAAAELLREPLVAIMRRGHRLAGHRGPLSVAALRDEPFIFYGGRMGLALPGQVIALCRAAGFEPRVSQIAEANATIIGLVAAGLGIAIVPEAMIRLRHDAIAARKLASPDAVTSVWIVRRHCDRAPLVQSFVSLLTAARRPARALSI